MVSCCCQGSPAATHAAQSSARKLFPWPGLPWSQARLSRYSSPSMTGCGGGMSSSAALSSSAPRSSSRRLPGGGPFGLSAGRGAIGGGTLAMRAPVMPPSAQMSARRQIPWFRGQLGSGLADEPLIGRDFPHHPLHPRARPGQVQRDEPRYPGPPLTPPGDLGVVLLDLGEGNAGAGSPVGESPLVCGALGGQQTA